jgi:hypothetical protein
MSKRSKIKKTYEYGEAVMCDQEVDNLVIRLASSQETFTEEQAQRLIDWAREIKVSYTLLQGIHTGLFKVLVRDGEEIAFQAVPVEQIGEIANPSWLRYVKTIME